MGSQPDTYRALFERSADAILIIDGETFVDCNEATVQMLRYRSRDEVLRTHPSDLSPKRQPDGRLSFEKANEMIAIAFEQGSHRFEWLHVRADGEVFPVEVLLTAVPDRGKNLLHVVWRDITKRKELEAKLRHSLKMEAIGKLAGGVAHDFNNLLVTILGHCDFLELGLRDPELIDHIREIQRAGERAAQLTQQLLAFSRKQVIAPRVVDLNVIVTELDRMLRRLIGENISLATEVAREAATVLMDPGQFEMAVLNLAANARDAMPSGGRLTISVDLPAGDPPTVQVRVTDNGTGMDAETMSKAFDPFFTTKPMGRGTGLGLATVYGIVHQSEGMVEVASEVGGGTTVTLTFPRAGESAAPPSEPNHLSHARGTETILVVEDDDFVRNLVRKVLTRNGYEVVEAVNGADAIRMFEEEQLDGVDMLLTDVIMPNMGGPELARRLSLLIPGLKILFASGYTDDTLTRSGVLRDGVDLLNKPFSPRALLTKVREILER